jgi:hypothetical protein
MNAAATEFPECQNDNGQKARPPGNTPASEFDSIPQLKFSDFVRSLKCPLSMEQEAQERTFRIVKKCKSALSLWQAAGEPDLGEWPDTGVDLLEYSCAAIIAAINKKANAV